MGRPARERATAAYPDRGRGPAPCARRGAWSLASGAPLSLGAAALVLAVALAATVSGCAAPSAEIHPRSSGGSGGPGSAGASGTSGAIEEGKATYYSRRLAGRRTASGERYDPALMTAAHWALPLGTRVRVTRLDVALPPVAVRINDRCAGAHKIIDLSEAAARRLQMMRAGIVPVRLEVLGGATNP